MVTLGPTVQGVDNVGSSVVGVIDEGNGFGVCSVDGLSSLATGSGCTWDRWNICPQAKPIRISFSAAMIIY